VHRNVFWLCLVITICDTFMSKEGLLYCFISLQLYMHFKVYFTSLPFPSLAKQVLWSIGISACNIHILLSK
jgi:hypothetical protein